MKPTAEQDYAVELGKTGASVKMNAKAGSGKTTTNVLIAKSSPQKQFDYIVYNRALADEAATKFPSNTRTFTAHALAMRNYCRPRGFYPRVQARTIPIAQSARMISADPIVVTVDGAQRRLAATFVAAAAFNAIDKFCQTGDAQPSWRHVKPSEALGEARSEANMEFRRHVAEYLPRIWADMMKPDGKLPYSHNAYLKGWAMSDPKMNTDCILYDEAQDANGAMLAIVEAQQARGIQVIYVGDPHQAIYEWNGAVDAMGKAHADHEAHLTMSFRFGQEIADVANRVLSILGDAHPIIGNPAITSRVGDFPGAPVMLCRTNAIAVVNAIADLKAGRKPFIVGGVKDIISFVEAAQALQRGGETSHPKLGAFSSWGEVIEHAEETGDGDLTRIIRLMDQFPDLNTMIRQLNALPKSEESADRIYSTGHKAKGREWAQVRIATDFPHSDPEMGDDGKPVARKATVEEMRLLYVAVTRPINDLDTGGHPDLKTPAPVAA